MDLDGVLVDSRDAMETAWRAVQHDVGVSTPFAAYFREIGRPFRDILERLGLSDEADEIERVFRATALREAPRVPAFPGIHTALARLDKRGVKLGVVTSKARSQTAWTLAQFDVEFATVQTPETRCPGKPAPYPLLVAASDARVDVRDSVFVGDMDVDALAARAAGMRFLHAGWGYGATPEGAERLRTPLELGEIGLPAPLAA
ncbi:MAG TPA: HAD family hydrolase [Conexibacter sp.]|nr:HAD family hydrolase [Conexibacter sp.]